MVQEEGSRGTTENYQHIKNTLYRWYTETVDLNVLIKKSIRKIMREADDHDRLKILRGQGLIKTLQMSYKEGFKMHPLTTSLT